MTAPGRISQRSPWAIWLWSRIEFLQLHLYPAVSQETGTGLA